MDIISAAIGSYLNLSSNLLTESFIESKSLEEKTISFDYEGYNIHYRHRSWTIKEKSVCYQYQKKDYREYSSCTIKAKKAFSDLCDRMVDKPTKSPFNNPLTIMYCDAAENYKPVIASASMSKPDSQLKKHQRECNTNILAEMEYRSPENTKEREISCEKYQLLKGSNSN